MTYDLRTWSARRDALELLLALGQFLVAVRELAADQGTSAHVLKNSAQRQLPRLRDSAKTVNNDLETFLANAN